MINIADVKLDTKVRLRENTAPFVYAITDAILHEDGLWLNLTRTDDRGMVIHREEKAVDCELAE